MKGRIEGQMNIFAIEAEQTHQEEQIGNCKTFYLYKQEGIKGSGETRGHTFPCRHSEFHYNHEFETWDEEKREWIKHEASQQILYNCDSYKPNPKYFDICGSCKHKNAFMDETNYCSKGEDQQPNYRCDFLEYTRTGKSVEHNLFEYCFKYYTCDNYEPDKWRKKEEA